MIEVVFSDSEKGNFKLARNFSGKDMSSGAIGYIGEKPSDGELEKYLKENREGEPLGDDSEDVVYIGFNLDMGEIDGEIDGAKRQKIFNDLWCRFNFTYPEQQEFFKTQRDDLEKLLSFARSGKSIRIWKSNSPYSACGFYYVCYLLKDIDCSNLSVITLPEYLPDFTGKNIHHVSWGEVHAGKLYKFLPLEKTIFKIEKQAYSTHWEVLMNENAPIRAIINGRLLSVVEDFYDPIIIKNIPSGEFVLARLIGEILIKYELGISDSLIASRIDKMISDKKLVIVNDEDKSHPYQEILRKSNEF